MPRAAKSTSKSDLAHQADRYCVPCRRGFSRPAEYRRHLTDTVTHNGKRAYKYSCKYCGDSFNNSLNHRAHEFNHIDGHPDRKCTLPLDKDGEERCDFSCSDPNAMIRHMGRAHPEAYSEALAQGNLPSWIEREKIRRRKASAQVRLESKQQTVEAERASGSHVAPTTPLTQMGQCPDSPLPSTSAGSPSPLGVQLFRLDTMEYVGSEPLGAETPVFQIAGMRSSSPSFPGATGSTPSSSTPSTSASSSSSLPATSDTIPLFFFSPSQHHCFNCGLSARASQSLVNQAKEPLNNISNYAAQPFTNIDMFPDVTSNLFPELQDNQFFGIGTSAPEWQAPQNSHPDAMDSELFNLDFFDYPQPTSSNDSFGSFYPNFQ